MSQSKLIGMDVVISGTSGAVYASDRKLELDQRPKARD
jgi:hypothetical protein